MRALLHDGDRSECQEAHEAGIPEEGGGFGSIREEQVGSRVTDQALGCGPPRRQERCG